MEDSRFSEDEGIKMEDRPSFSNGWSLRSLNHEKKGCLEMQMEGSSPWPSHLERIGRDR